LKLYFVKSHPPIKHSALPENRVAASKMRVPAVIFRLDNPECSGYFSHRLKLSHNYEQKDSLTGGPHGFQLRNVRAEEKS
jgi:hypothetical protein